MRPLICLLLLVTLGVAAPSDLQTNGPITGAAYSPDGKTLATAEFSAVSLQDAETGKVLRTFTGHPGKVNAVHFSPDGKQLLAATGVTGASGVAILWNVASGEKLREYGNHRDVLYDAEFSPDGSRIATAGYDRRIRIWDTASGKALHVIEVHNGAIFDLAFSPDGAVLASASADETVKLWNVESGKRLDTLHQPEGEQYTVTFTPDGKFVLAAGADNRIRMWRFVSTTTPKINPLIRSRFAHEGTVVRLQATPDGKYLVSTADDKALKYWSLPDLQQRGDYPAQPDVVSMLDIRPGTEELLVTRMDGSMERYSLGVQGEEEAKGQWQSGKAVAAVGKLQEISEAEPNDKVSEIKTIMVPAKISGVIGQEGDADLYRFAAKAGEEWVVEVNAARQKSPLDSKIEILDASGEPVEWALLQAVRDSWINFRGIDSDTSDGLRLHNWEEMEINEYFYFNGEVVKFWLYPRGPDSGFKLYPGFGNRYTYFGTTALAHPLGEPGYIVRALPPGSDPKPNGLPTFQMYYENDDEPMRRWGADSYLLFTAPADGEYVALVRDVRGFGGQDYKYDLTIRPSAPDYKIKVEQMNPKVAVGSGQEFVLNVDRFDGFEGEIKVEIEGLPPGFGASSPIIIEAGQDMAQGVVYAAPDAPALTEENAKASKLIATAEIRGETIRRVVGTLGKIELVEAPKVYVEIHPSEGKAEPGKPVEFVIEPGETITGRVEIKRNGYGGRASFGKEDAGRNFPHGLYIDNIGLNGLMITENETERTFFITAAKWVPDTTRMFHLKVTESGGQCSIPAIIHVRAK